MSRTGVIPINARVSMAESGQVVENSAKELKRTLWKKIAMTSAKFLSSLSRPKAPCAQPAPSVTGHAADSAPASEKAF